MTITNKPFVLSETLFASWVISHTSITQGLQDTLLIVSIIAGLIGIYKSLFSKKKQS